MSRRVRSAKVSQRLEILEPRQLLDHGVTRILQHESFVTQAELNTWAWTLVRHPKEAAQLGLADLGNALRSHPNYVRQHGLSSLVVRVLENHPSYASKHGLNRLLSSSFTSTAFPIGSGLSSGSTAPPKAPNNHAPTGSSAAGAGPDPKSGPAVPAPVTETANTNTANLSGPIPPPITPPPAGNYVNDCGCDPTVNQTAAPSGTPDCRCGPALGKAPM